MQHKASTPRIPAIDVAKGIGIYCIVLGHVIPNSLVYSLLYAFHVPLFFVLSGLTFHLKDDKRRFYADKARRILMPYAVFSIISIILYRLAAPLISLPAGEAHLMPNLWGMLYANTNNGLMNWNRPLWFLPCLFAVLALVDGFETLLHRLQTRHPQLLRSLFVAVALAAGTLLNIGISGLYLPFQLESAVLLAAFAELGVILQHLNRGYHLTDKIQALSMPRLCACMLPLLIAGCLASQLNGHIDIRAHMLGQSTLLMFLAAACLSLVVLVLSARLQRCSLLQQWGLHSLSILLVHKFPILLFQLLLPFTRSLLASRNTLQGFLCGVAVSVATMYLCLWAGRLLSRYFPGLLGKRRAQ